MSLSDKPNSEHEMTLGADTQSDVSFIPMNTSSDSVESTPSSDSDIDTAKPSRSHAAISYLSITLGGALWLSTFFFGLFILVWYFIRGVKNPENWNIILPDIYSPDGGSTAGALHLQIAVLIIGLRFQWLF